MFLEVFKPDKIQAVRVKRDPSPPYRSIKQFQPGSYDLHPLPHIHNSGSSGGWSLFQLPQGRTASTYPL